MPRDSRGRPIQASQLHSKKLQLSFPVHYQISDNYYNLSKEELTHQRVYVLLHGMGNDALFMEEKIGKKIREYRKDDITLSLDAPFPIKHPKKNQYGKAWYFYNSETSEYLITQDYPTSLIICLLKELKLDQSNITFIGYSQGGYLAPFVAQELSSCKRIITIAACIRHEYLNKALNFKIDCIHGEYDTIVDYKNAKESHTQSLKKSLGGDFHTIKNEHHRLTLPLIKKLLQIL